MVIGLVRGIIFVFSVGYLVGDRRRGYFRLVLFMFVLAMLMLVLSGSRGIVLLG